MADELWGVGPDARRAARPVVVCAALGVAAFVFTFAAALLLGRGLSGSALAALLLPLALSGAIAVGLAVAFVVAVALEHPYGAGRARRLVPVVTPLAALVALFVYAADPTGDAARPATGAQGAPATRPLPTPRVPRIVSVPSDPAPPSDAGPENVPAEVLGTRTRRPSSVAVAGPALPRPAALARPVARPAPTGGTVALRPDVLHGAYRGPTAKALRTDDGCPKKHCKYKGKKSKGRDGKGKGGKVTRGRSSRR